MQGSFEKKVQSTLDELKLAPSAPLWEKIEAQIKPEKKRRRGLFWLPVGLLLLAGGWWLWTGTETQPAAFARKEITAAPAQTTATPSTPEKKTPSGSERRREIVMPQPPSPLPAVPASAVKTKKENTAGQQTSSPLSPVLAAAKKGAPGKTAEPGLRQPPASDTKPAPVDEGEKTPPTADSKSNNPTASEKAPAGKPPVGAITEDLTPVEKKPAPLIDSTTTAVPPAGEKKPAPLLTDTAAARRKVALAKKWRLTVTAQAGWSGASSVSTALSNYYSSPIQNNGGGFNSAVIGPSAVNNHSVFAAGVGLSKEMNDRLQVSVGLQFALYRSRTAVGNFRPLDTSLYFNSRDVMLGGYYVNGRQQNYSIRHQVLELPVTVGYRLLPSRRLLFEAGALYGHLLGSNALTFNQTGNFYYENKENFSRHQVALVASLPYRFVHKKTVGFSVGPMVQYRLTSFQKETMPPQRKLLFAGIKTSLNF